MKILVTGGAGFIGTNFIRETIKNFSDIQIIALDKIGYAGKSTNIADLPNTKIIVGDITNQDLVNELVKQSDIVVHFAAESHNDNSIRDASPFIYSNIVGTFNILQAVHQFEKQLHHVSTDEVYGDLAIDDPEKFTSNTPYNPSSPYSASKASSDMLVRAWVRSFNIRATISNCSNNYGPYQHIEKFIPRMITNRILGVRPKLYGDGINVRDWIHVHDHNSAVWEIIKKGQSGQTYIIGANGEINNLQVVQMLNNLMGYPENDFDHVSDRPGHDRRYAIDNTYIIQTLGWQPLYNNFRSGIENTIEWYSQNTDFWKNDKKAIEESYAKYGQ